jgi:hypothetical protein
MKRERTTDLIKLKSGAEFTWGEIIKIHEIAEYAIIEYYPWCVKGREVLTGLINTDKTNYSCYINNKCCSSSFDNIDAALVYCIAYKHDGINTQAHHYFMKAIA